MIPIFRPSMGKEEVAAVAEVLASGWIGLGPRTKQFEDAFAHYIGVRYASGVNSATAALHLAVAALGIGPGDEVLVPAITFVSTALAASYCGARPMFVDVEPGTLNLDVDDCARKITRRTKAMIVVHFGGHPARMEELKRIARRHKLYLIEDCAHSCGADYQGKKTGRLGHIGCFSFHAVKNLATGDGGMVTTDNRALDSRIRKLRWLGIDKDTYRRTDKKYSWHYEVKEIGWKYHMNDITAAIGLVQLAKLDRLNQRRRQIAACYQEAFSRRKGIEIPVELPGVSSSWHNYVIKVSRRNELIASLAKHGIAAGVHYMPLHLHPIYRDRRCRLPVAEAVWTQLVTLPLYPDMTDEQIRQVTSAVAAFFGHKGQTS